MVVDGAVPSERHIAEELATLASLAVFVGADKPFCPALIHEDFLEGLSHLGFAKGNWHRVETAERNAVEQIEFLVLVFLLDFVLEHFEFLAQTGHGDHRNDREGKSVPECFAILFESIGGRNGSSIGLCDSNGLLSDCSTLIWLVSINSDSDCWLAKRHSVSFTDVLAALCGL